MCLFLTIAAVDEDVNAARFKRVLKGASSLSVFGDAADGAWFSLGNDAHCSCDLHTGGPDGTGAGISIVPAAGESLVKVAEAAIGAGFAPLEIRVFWGNDAPSETIEMTLSEFRHLVADNSFDGRASYFVVA
jgi:hypothetical protein